MDRRGRRPQERLARIAASIGERGSATFEELARENGVSEMTIRRDVGRLEAEGRARKVLGGAIASSLLSVEPDLDARSGVAAEGKRLIAEAVVGLLSPGETVILDSGTTCLAVARAMRGRSLNLTVLTPSLAAAVELAREPGFNVYVVGGRVRTEEPNLVGPEAEQFIAHYAAQTFVMGVAGLDAARGITDFHSGETGVKRAAMAAASRTIAVADRTKLGMVRFFVLAPLEALDTIVTDGKSEDPTLTAATQSGVRVVPVPGEAPARGEPLDK